MSNQMIRPRQGVQVPSGNQQYAGAAQQMGNPQVGGMGNQNQFGMQQQMSPGDQIKAMLNNSLQSNQSQQGGGFNWGRYDNNSYEDEALRALMTPEEQSIDSMAYYVDRVAQPMQVFMQQMFHRTGQFFEEYKKAKESFKFSTDTSMPCNIRKSFIEDVDRLHEFTRTMSINAAPFFGYRLINILKETNKDAFNTEDYLSSAFTAVRNVLFFELVNWLNGSSKGRLLAPNLTKELSDRINNIENFKEATTTTFDVFGLNNPYGSIEFKLVTATRSDYSMLSQPTTTFVTGQSVGVSEGYSQDNHLDEITQLIMRNSSERKGVHYNRPVEHKPNPVDWNQERKDFENLTPDNVMEYNLSKYFTNIGKRNHYFIPESDWKAIKHGYVKHSEMGVEETVVPGTFRVVIINLDEPRAGWFSTIVRDERLDIVTILSDPSRLLKKIKSDDEYEEEMLALVNTKNYPKDTGFVEIEEAAKMTDKIPLIAVDEPIVAKDSGELEATVNAVNKRLTTNIRTHVGVGFNTTVKDTYTCNRESDKSKLIHSLPMLFADKKLDTTKSLLQCYSDIYSLFTDRVLDGKLMVFIDTKLTNDFNNWLVNVLGYSHNKNHPDHLSVDSILQDFEEIFEIFKEENQTAKSIMLDSDHTRTYLGKQIGMFEIGENDNKPSSLLTSVKDDFTLTLTKDIYINVINNHGGPLYDDANVPVVIKRSKFPEIFEMVENGFKTVIGDSGFTTTDKLIHFTSNDHYWLFNKSIIDPNVATLRHVSRTKPLVLLEQD